MLTTPRIARFSPRTATASEAWDRATLTPRAIRELGSSLVEWALSNIARDAASPFGDLPERFGFARDDREPALPRGGPYHARLTAATRLFVTESRLVCAHTQGSVILRAIRFELEFTSQKFAAGSAPLPERGHPPATAVDWVIGWACVGRSLVRLARYERWATDTYGERYTLDRSLSRPKAARKSAVAIHALPAALDAMAEWCADAELAMLTWIIADARKRGEQPILPVV